MKEPKIRKTSIDLVVAERREQIEKHGRTIERDVRENKDYQLSRFAAILCTPFTNSFNSRYEIPYGWDKDVCYKMLNKTYKEKLIIASALIIAELDRIEIAGVIAQNIIGYDKTDTCQHEWIRTTKNYKKDYRCYICKKLKSELQEKKLTVDV